MGFGAIRERSPKCTLSWSYVGFGVRRCSPKFGCFRRAALPFRYHGRCPGGVEFLPAPAPDEPSDLTSWVGAVADEPLRVHQGRIRTVTAAAETLLERALTLPPEERASLASSLVASLDSESFDENEVEALWSAESARRAAQLSSGEAELGTWDHLVSRIDERRA